jgi:outer membrane protein
MCKSCFLQKLLVVAALGLFSPPLAAQEELTLSQAVARALESNPDLAADDPGQRAARSEFNAAKAGYLPRLDFEQSYLAGNNPVFVFGTLLTQQRFGPANFDLPALNSPASIDNLQTRVTLRQNIWDFGRTRDQRRQALLGAEMADLEHEEHVRQILLAVLDGYYSVSLADEALETARVALRSAEAIEAQAKARVESGLAVEADLLRSRVYLSMAKQQEIQNLGRLESARAQLNRMMGRAIDSSIGDTAELMLIKTALPSEGILIAEQKGRRPDYKRIQTELREAELSVGLKKKEFRPVLAGYGTWEADNPSINEYGGNNWAAGITLSLNLFAGGKDAAQLAAARQRLEQKRRQATAMESAMALEVRRALIQFRTAAKQVDAAQAAEAQSEEGLRILKNRYDAGLATMTDLLSAEAARSSARTALSEAIYRHRLSFAQVEYAAGILSPTSPGMSLH